MSWKEWDQGEVVEAGDLQEYIQDQVVQNYADSAARSTALGTAVAEGMVSYLQDSNSVEVYNGSAWVAVGNDLSSGTAGYTALSNGTAGLSYQPVSHNYVINGAMEIDQRVSPHAFGARTYTLDRWTGARVSSVAGATVSKVSSGLANIPNALRIQRDSGNTSTNDIAIHQNFENAGIELAGKEVSFSFYARAGADLSGRLTPRVQSSTSTPESQTYSSNGRFATGTTDFAVNIFTPSTDWTRYNYTLTVPSNANAMQIEFNRNSIVGTAGANDWIEITGVQLEAGSIATPFKRNANSIAGELAACQRYYQRLGGANTATGDRFVTSYVDFSNSVQHALALPTPTRITPTDISFTNVNLRYSGSSNTSVDAIQIRRLLGNVLSFSTSHLTPTLPTGEAVQLRADATGAYIEIEAEL